MLLAEELDVDWSQVKAELAPAGDAYKDPFFGIQMTGGSSAVTHSWVQYREIGAATRAMLVAAAAAAVEGAGGALHDRRRHACARARTRPPTRAGGRCRGAARTGQGAC